MPAICLLKKALDLFDSRFESRSRLDLLCSEGRFPFRRIGDLKTKGDQRIKEL